MTLENRNISIKNNNKKILVKIIRILARIKLFIISINYQSLFVLLLFCKINRGSSWDWNNWDVNFFVLLQSRGKYNPLIV